MIFEKIKGISNEKDLELEALRDAVKEIKTKNPAYFAIEGDIIDEALASFLNSRDYLLLIPFEREAYGLYRYGSKKVGIIYEREKLIIKIGGGFMPIQSFIDNYTEIEVDKLNKNFESPKMKTYSPSKLDFAKIDLERIDTPIIEEDV